MAGTLEFIRFGKTDFGCELVTAKGSRLLVQGRNGEDRVSSGDEHLRDNPGVLANSWAFACHEFQYRRLRAKEARESHAKQAAKHRKTSLSIAEMVDWLGVKHRVGWCSACFTRCIHFEVEGRWRWANTGAYLCSNCGSPTARCMAPKCKHMANRNTSTAGLPRYCAEHRHDVPDFESIGERLDDLADYSNLLKWRSRNLAAGTKISIGALAVGAALAPAALVAAPAIGGALGASVLGGSLTGAAATSHGLAMLGLGSLASGGFGMAGGTAVIVAAGAGLGSAMGAVSTSAYVSDDKSFKIKKLRGGTGAPILLIAGFLSEGSTEWEPWRGMIDDRWPDRPVYRIWWGSKELKALAALFGSGLAKGAAAQIAKLFAKQATKAGARQIPLLGWLAMIPGAAANPWTVALARTEMTAAVLADLMARTDEDSFVLVGHSLGALVAVQTAELLSGKSDVPPLESVHLLGAAVPRKRDLRLLNDSVSEGVWNYYSTKDTVLKLLYRYAQFGGPAAGAQGFKSSFTRIRDVDVSKTVPGHSDYFTGVSLR